MAAQRSIPGHALEHRVRQSKLRLWLMAFGLVGWTVHADPFINEILFNPPGSDLPNEYIELRGTPNLVLTNIYLVVVEGDTNNNPGTIQNIFDLDGRAVGGNGFLVLLQKANSYVPNTNATLLINTGSGAGWGSGSSSSIGHRGESGQTDLENGSQTFFLIQTPSAPSVGADIDSDDNGAPDGPAFASWTILDSVGVMDVDGDVGYGAINFRRNPAGIASGTVVAVSFNPSYVGRTGNTTGSGAADWVASDNLGGIVPTWTLGSAANTVPSSLFNQPLNHIGGPNFGAPAIPGVVINQPGGSTDVTEGGGTDFYTIALSTTPAGNVTIQINASGQTQISTDGGASFGSARSVTLNSVNARAILVRAVEDNVVDTSPHVNRITHQINVTADPTHYPLSTPIPNVDVRITDTDLLLLSELKVNPPGEDAPYEFMELRGSPNTTLRNVYLLVIEGDAGANPGTVRVVLNLNNTALGSSGLLVIAANGNPYLIPSGTTVILDSRLDQAGGALGNGTISFLLVSSPTNIPEGVDLDGGDNGVLEELPVGTTILDAVSWSDGGAGDVVYGGVELTQNSGTPDAATRFSYNNTPLSAAAWFNGDLAGTNGNSLVYDPNNVSANFPIGTPLSPGIFNNTAPSINPIAPFSGVIADPANPGVEFTVNDAETDPSQLTVAAHSSNPLVVPDANLTIVVGAGGRRTLYVNPVGIGYATITLTVSDDDKASQRSFPYAASAMGRPGGRFHTEVSDGSTAIAIDPDLMFVGDDENQLIRLYRRNQSGGPLTQFDFNLFLGLTDLYETGLPKEVDIEASTRAGNRIYWMGGHSHGMNAEARTNRARIFSTDLSGTGTNATLTFAGRYDFLKVDLITWDVNNLHGKGANYYGLAASAAVGVDAKAPDGSGFNIEGLCMAPGSSNTAYVAFRAPLVPPTNRVMALIVPVTNFDTVAISTNGPGAAQFGPPIELNLDCHGIRSIEGNTNGYLIVAGPPDVATEVPPKDFRLFTWSGNPADQPQEREANLSGMIPEGIVELPASPWTTNSQVQLISDNGITVYYNDGVEAKHLTVRNFKKFRSDWVTLGAVVVPRPMIRNITVSGNDLVLTWKAVIGRTYRIQCESDVGRADWIDVPGDVPATDVIATKSVPLGPGRQRFYRVMLLP